MLAQLELDRFEDLKKTVSFPPQDYLSGKCKVFSSKVRVRTK
ncbi:MAG: hypothetical protein CM15mP127_05770 [Gammaproteobacteria bacterium]|nr:MAG: hypothetical protein CM15mP127_05770 [Gammaproteobacteria bacterium]